MTKEREERWPNHWSYSAWSVWKGCKYKYYRGYILGIREPPNRFMARGIEVHRQAEFYLTKQIHSLPPLFNPFIGAMKQMRSEKPVVEQFWGVSDRWKYVDGKSWCVMKMDAAVEPQRLGGWLYVVDWKTGREYESHAKQGELYSCIGMAKYPKAKGVISEFYYLDQGYPTQVKYPAKYLLRKQNFWLEQGHAMLDKKQKFLPEPSLDSCTYCYHRSDKAGDCNGWKKFPQLRGR